MTQEFRSQITQFAAFINRAELHLAKKLGGQIKGGLHASKLTGLLVSCQILAGADPRTLHWQITFNIIGHTGFEIYPKWLMDSWLGKILNTPTNHAMHHEKLRGNYGLYFNIWDRLMKTNHADYEKRFREVTGRGKSAE